MKIATRLTDEALLSYRAYFHSRCINREMADKYLDDASNGGNHGVDEYAGCTIKTAGRHEISGNPNAVQIKPDEYVWEENQD